jgi:hypothetical protein
MLAPIAKMRDKKKEPATVDAAPARGIQLLRSRMQSNSTNTCLKCGKSFTVKPSHRAKRKYCRMACRNDAERKTNRADYFWARVSKGADCWLWTGPRRKNGYGKMMTSRPNRRWLVAHRFSWELHNGPIPAGMHVCHRCDNPTCVRPDHLFLGTDADNAADKVSKGRQSRGEDRPLAKLTFREVREIRRHYAMGGLSQSQLARAFKVNQTLIGMVIRRAIWKHVADCDDATGVTGAAAQA